MVIGDRCHSRCGTRGHGNTGSMRRVIINLVVIVVLMFVGDRTKFSFGGVDAFTPETELPVGKGTSLSITGFDIFDNDGPVADGVFTPVSNGHERPVNISIRRLVALACGGEM